MVSGVELSFEFRNKRYQQAEAGLRALGKSIETSPERVSDVLRKHLEEFLNEIAKAMAERHGTPYPGGTTENSLSARSGFAKQQILGSVKVTGEQLATIQGTIGGGKAYYLKTHEYGATITPKKAKYLTIPLPAALNSNGTPKKKSARDWINTFVATSKKGNLIIFQKTGSKIVPLYVLKKSVTIKPRLGMRKALEGGVPYFVDRAVDAMLKELIAL